MAMDLYFAPQYFSPHYFPSMAGTDGGKAPEPSRPPEVSGQVMRDRDGLVAVAAALRGSGEFAAVEFGRAFAPSLASADLFPLALIVPRGWVEQDGEDPVQPFRRVCYDLVLSVRGDDAWSRIDALDRLSSIAQNAVNGLDLGEGCIPALTRIRSGRFDRRSRHPEQRVVLAGEFAYVIPDGSSRATSD